MPDMATQTATGLSLRTSTVAAAEEAIKMASSNLPKHGIRAALVFVSPSRSLEQALSSVRTLLPEAEVVGCTTAGEFTEHGSTHSGIGVMLIAGEELQVSSLYAAHVSNDPRSAAEALAAGFERDRTEASKSGLAAINSVLLVDGLNSQGEGLIDTLLKTTGSAHEIVGGAAGDEGAFKATLVGTKRFVGTNAAVSLRVVSPKRWGIGVAHGFTPVSAMMRVTKTEGAVVHEIEGRPAFETYKEFAASKGIELNSKNATSFMINNELGVHLFNQFQMIRAPIDVRADGSIVCAAAVPRGASVSILGASRESLVDAAQTAAREAKQRLRGAEAAGVLLFDCVCRGAILGERFDDELRAVKSVFPDVPLAGFLTYGEIARYSGKLDGWHNATAVVAAIPR
jgi:hypothetical protein